MSEVVLLPLFADHVCSNFLTVRINLLMCKNHSRNLVIVGSVNMHVVDLVYIELSYFH